MVRHKSFADFGPFAENEAGEKKGQERVECGHERAIWPIGEVCRLSHEPAQTRGNCRYQMKKAPTENSWGFVIGGGTRNRTRVRHPSRSPSARTQSGFSIIWPFSRTLAGLGEQPTPPGSLLSVVAGRHRKIANAKAKVEGNAFALTWQGDCITMSDIHPL
jgi:hypothetical protein